MNTSFGKQLKMKHEIFLFLLLMIMDISTNAQEVTCEGEQLINVDILIGHPGIVSPYKPGHILVFRCTDVNLKMHGQRMIECLSNGKWNHPYPKCEEASCERKTTEKNIRVEGLPAHRDDLIRYGHRLTFACVGEGLMLKGEKEITCQSNGEWSSPFPKCAEASCERKNTEENIRVEGLPAQPEDLMRYGHRLTFACVGEGLMLKGEKEITCQSNGEWSSPFPKCVEVTCEGEQLIDVRILTKHPRNSPPYKPGHILVFRCTDVNMKMHGQRAIECLSNGKWNHPYPKCEGEVTCEREQLNNVDILTGHPRTAPPYKPGHVLVFHCTDVNLRIQKQQAIECLSNGKWDHPYPKCEEIRCEVPRDQHVYRPSEYFREDMKLGAKQPYHCEPGYDKMAEEATCTRGGWTPNPLCAKNSCEVPRDQHVYRPSEYFRGDMKWGSKQPYRCEPGYDKMAEEATCTRDGWTPNPLCAMMTVTGKCGPPPQVSNADTIEMTKNEYDTGERVEYICFNKYVMDMPSLDSKYLTCQQGKWKGSIKCLKPCTVTKEIMNERGIDLAFANQQKLFAPHNDRITFMCLRGKVSVGIDFKQECHDGKMTLPKCV